MKTPFAFFFACSFAVLPTFAESVPEKAPVVPASGAPSVQPQTPKPPKATPSAAKITGDELVTLAWTDLSGLRGALLRGANPNARTHVGDYPIIRLAYGGNVEALEILLDFNARTDVLNLSDSATSAGTLRSLTSFVTENEKMELKNFSVATAIINASPQVTEMQKIRMMQLILDYGFSPDFRDGWGQTALMTCVRLRFETLAKLLVAYGADGEANDLRNGKTARDYADTEEMFRILRGRKLYVPSKRPSYGQIPVRLIRPKKIPLIRRDLMPKKISQSTRESSLHLAVKDGDVVLVRDLLAEGAQAVTYDLEQKTALHRLCEKPEIPFAAFREIYRLLENEGGSKILLMRDRLGRIPFHYLCRSGRDDLATLLASKDAKQLNAVDSEQNTPLHFAVAAGKDGRDATLFLLEKGVPVYRKNKADETPLHLAARNADAEMFYLLFSELRNDPVSGLNPIVGDSLFSTTVSAFSSGNNRRNENLVEILRLLIENGTDPNFANPDTGNNALHTTVTANCPSAVRYLLTTNIDINKKNHLGETPLDLAAKLPEIRRLLLARDARQGKIAAEEKRAEREEKAKMTARERRAERIRKKTENGEK